MGRYRQLYGMKPASIFTTLSCDELAELDSATSIRRARRHETVFEEGQALSHLYLLQSGTLKLVRPMTDGRALIVTLVQAGDSFGAMLAPRVTASRAQALEDAVYLMVPLDIIRRISSANGEFALALLADSEARRHETEERATRLAFEPVSRRLARLLVDTSDEQSGELLFPLTQTEMANIIGSRRETVCSLLNRFRRDRTISILRGRVRIRDRERLSSLT